MQTPTEQPTTLSGYSDSERKAILRGAVDHENALHKKAHIQIVPSDDLNHFIATHQRDDRMHLIVEKEGHYCAVDLLQQDDHKSCIILDAANDETSQKIAAELSAQGFTVMRASGLDHDHYADQNLQTDTLNSSLFALDHGILLSQAPNDLHATLQTQTTEGHFPWEALPAPFLRNAQSVDFLEQYLQKHPDVDVETKQYIQTGLREQEEGGTLTTQNDAINSHVFLHAHHLYQKEKIIEAMVQAIQESDHSWEIFDKPARKIELTRIKNEFAAAELSGDPTASPYVQAFDAAVDQTQWRHPDRKAATEYRSQMQTLRQGEEAEPTSSMEVRL